MLKTPVTGPRERFAFLFLFWLAMVPIWVLAIGEVVSNLAGQRWIPSLDGVEWAFLLMFGLVLVMLRMVAEKTFPPDNGEER